MTNILRSTKAWHDRRESFISSPALCHVRENMVVRELLGWSNGCTETIQTRQKLKFSSRVQWQRAITIQQSCLTHSLYFHMLELNRAVQLISCTLYCIVYTEHSKKETVILERCLLVYVCVWVNCLFSLIWPIQSGVFNSHWHRFCDLLTLVNYEELNVLRCKHIQRDWHTPTYTAVLQQKLNHFYQWRSFPMSFRNISNKRCSDWAAEHCASAYLSTFFFKKMTKLLTYIIINNCI